MIKNGYIQSMLFDVLEFVKTPKLLKTEVFTSDEFIDVVSDIEIEDHLDYRSNDFLISQQFIPHFI